MADPASLQATLMPNRAPRLGQPGAAEAKSARAGAPAPTAASDAARDGALGPVQLERLKVEVAEVRAQLDRHGVDIHMEPQDGLDPAIIRMVDRETGETVRQIPPKEWLDMRRNLMEGKGLVVSTIA
jgi:flagellar protein FlaG